MAKHPYLSGNRAPISEELALTGCTHIGVIPVELHGGMYVRNGSNPSPGVNGDISRDYHLFDGDGLLSGVYFSEDEMEGVRPFFTSQFIRTDVFLQTYKHNLRRPLLPSISTMVSPGTSLLKMFLVVTRTFFYFVLSLFSDSPLKRISVANTSVMWWDGYALATCESGPPMQVSLPGLSTVGWWPVGTSTMNGNTYTSPIQGLRGFFDEWTTAHPHVDPITNEFVAFHSSFVPPYLRYSVVQPNKKKSEPAAAGDGKSRFSAPIPLSSPRMMHDFGVSLHHTIILDLPLSLDPLALLHGAPMLEYKPAERCRFGVFPRYRPDLIRWYTLATSCLIFHTVNTWTDVEKESVNLLACRMSGDSLIWAAGNLQQPQKPGVTGVQPPDECLLYYYRISLSDEQVRHPAHAFPLLSIPFEFPAVPFSRSMQTVKYVYGCSMMEGTFTSALETGAKINVLVKINVQALIAKGLERGYGERSDPVDSRTIGEIWDDQERSGRGEYTVNLFRLPKGWYAQEVSFVPRNNAQNEDDGWLMTYVFDESQLIADGSAPSGAHSELWIIDARSMQHVVGRILLPQRVPYGLHGTFFSKDQIEAQKR